MKKKELKTLNLDELEAQKNEQIALDEESNADVRVDINSLSAKPPTIASNLANISKKVEGEVERFNLEKEELKKKERFKNYEGDGSKGSIISFLSNKHIFDKKVYNIRNLIILCIMVAAVVYIKINPESTTDLSLTKMIETDLKRFPRRILGGIVKMAIRSYGSTYPIFIAIFLYFFPLKRHSRHMVAVYFDGITVPSEVFPTGSPKRNRVKWKNISWVDFAKKEGIPYMQIFDSDNDLLGEIRLDMTNMKGFYRAIDTYAPPENPVRKLFTNVKNC